jgi:hypothetical protein
VVSMACLSYTAKKLELIVEDFWEEDELYKNFGPAFFEKGELYFELSNTFALPKALMSKAMAHMLAFY